MLRPLDIAHVWEFDWIIFGGESGNRARPCDLRWIRDGIILCRGVQGCAPFVKQLGANAIDKHGPVQFRDSHGGDWDEWPSDLRVREFPRVN